MRVEGSLVYIRRKLTYLSFTTISVNVGRADGSVAQHLSIKAARQKVNIKIK
jgi:hypothetical protein